MGKQNIFLNELIIRFILAHFRNLADQLQAVVSEMGTKEEDFVRNVSYGLNGEITITLYDKAWMEDMVNECNDEKIDPSVICIDG